MPIIEYNPAVLVFLVSAAFVAVFFAIMLFLVARSPSPVQAALQKPRFEPADLFLWDGTVGRGVYASAGVLLFAVKHNLDRFIASLGFHRPWSLFNYWVPSKGFDLSALGRQDLELYATLLVAALPFIWIGVALTLRRLRSAKLPQWLVFLFFIPLVNLIFFLALAIAPPEPGAAEAPVADRRPGFLQRVIPEDSLGATAVAIFLSLPLAVGAAWLSTSVFKQYGWGLFVGVPFCQGLMASLLHSYHRPRTFSSCMLVSCFACLATGWAIFALAVEGLICIAMAFPFALALTVMGGAVGYFIQRNVWSRPGADGLLAVLVLFLPVFMGAEYAAKPQPPLWAVRTSIDVHAPPERVWKNVVSFAEMPPPTEWIFKVGVAHPLRAVIDGHGPGAVRHCVFSTGEFVEPIEVWQEPRLLKFSVTAQPASMEEWSPYGRIETPHLHNYLVSRGGQFLLTPLPDGGTRLEGTTWYQDSLWPSLYWKLWSDAVIHRIHLRVLRHIRASAQQQPA